MFGCIRHRKRSRIVSKRQASKVYYGIWSKSVRPQSFGTACSRELVLNQDNRAPLLTSVNDVGFEEGEGEIRPQRTKSKVDETEIH